MLYFHTRATSVGISMQSNLLASFSVLAAEFFSISVLPQDSSVDVENCDLLLDDHWFVAIPWLILALQQLWFVSRMAIQLRRGSWLLFTLRKTTADHSERQSAREDEDVTMGLRFGVSQVLVLKKDLVLFHFPSYPSEGVCLRSSFPCLHQAELLHSATGRGWRSKSSAQWLESSSHRLSSVSL